MTSPVEFNDEQIRTGAWFSPSAVAYSLYISLPAKLRQVKKLVVSSRNAPLPAARQATAAADRRHGLRNQQVKRAH
jgi:hypothetical protein